MIALTYILGFVIVAVICLIPSTITIVLGIVSALSLLSFGVLWKESGLRAVTPDRRAIWWIERMKLYVTKFRIVETRYSATSDLYDFVVEKREFGLTWRTVYSTGLKDKEKGMQSAAAQLAYIINRIENAAFPIKRIVMEARSINDLRKDPNE